MFLYILEFRKPNKTKLFREKCFKNVVPNLWEKNAYVSTKQLFCKFKNWKQPNIKKLKAFIIFDGL